MKTIPKSDKGAGLHREQRLVLRLQEARENLRWTQADLAKQPAGQSLAGASCCASLVSAASLVLCDLQKTASKLRKSRHHNALHDLHIIECAISAVDDIIILHNS